MVSRGMPLRTCLARCQLFPVQHRHLDCYSYHRYLPPLEGYAWKIGITRIELVNGLFEKIDGLYYVYYVFSWVT